MALEFHSKSPNVDEEKGFTCTPDQVKQLLFVVRTARSDNLFMDWQKGNARRVAAAACGVVDEKEVPMDFSLMPNPTDWAEDDKDAW